MLGILVRNTVCVRDRQQQRERISFSLKSGSEDPLASLGGNTKSGINQNCLFILLSSSWVIRLAQFLAPLNIPSVLTMALALLDWHSTFTCGAYGSVLSGSRWGFACKTKMRHCPEEPGRTCIQKAIRDLGPLWQMLTCKEETIGKCWRWREDRRQKDTRLGNSMVITWLCSHPSCILYFFHFYFILH